MSRLKHFTGFFFFPSVTNPIDVIKIRMQLDNELNSRHAGNNIFKNRYYKGFLRGGIRIFKDEGITGLYKGLFPSLLREASYSTIRLGAYEPIKVSLGALDPANTPLWKKITAGAISGTIGSTIANPTDLVKVRFQAVGPGQPARYRSTFQAFAVIVREEGVRGLWTGVGPTVQRAAILTATQIPSYDHTKHTLINHKIMKEGPPLHVVSSFVAGLVAAGATSPVDVVKTRIMNQATDSKGRPKIYSGITDCFIKIIKNEGFLGLYKGFIPNWMRIGPHTIVTFFVFEQLRKLVGMKPV
ncbi:mitochondrial substrate carrier family protein ucpB isoform X2 [Exaiptasia diaphana]|uniref:Uncharacterized protein n=1 Tax=Exaiptasia diaphana TaxID=2652724 RepID=A0A913YEZ9_EXADI|nr:mitochondrial substrate carrier family protein ucpB isoform X2 [Exaiptasia diaphana]XP_028513573.1 mitochondrial substrate carrier family protein ucpB isoform X2 [Exaiptasia diaphana]